MTEFVLYEEKYNHKTIDEVKAFWLTHDVHPSNDDIRADLAAWTANGHQLYLIFSDEAQVGFFHLGSRGESMDWLEDIFVETEHRCMGLATRAIRFAENIVSENGGECMYIEVVPRNIAALKLYRNLGYDVLNTLTIRHDFCANVKTRTQSISNMDFFY